MPANENEKPADSPSSTLAGEKPAYLPRLQNYNRLLAVIVAGGFLYKLFSLFLIFPHLQQYGLERMGWDSPTYYLPAMQMARGFPFHSEVRTPGYPAFLAFFYLLTHDPNPISTLNLTVLFVSQSLLLSLGCLPIAGAIRRLTRSDRPALWGAGLWAVNNSARFYANMLLTEALTAALTCLLAYALVRSLPDRSDSEDGKKWRWHLASGLLLFCLALVRPSLSLWAIPLFLALSLVWYRERERIQWKPHLAGLLVFMLILPLSAPKLWSLRNRAVEGKSYYCRLSAFGLYAFGFKIPMDEAKGISAEASHANSWQEFFRLLPRMSPQAMDAMYKSRTLQALRQEPGPILVYLAKSSLYLFLPTMNKPLGRSHYSDTVKPSFWHRLTWAMRLEYAFYLLNSLAEGVVLMGMLALILARFLPRFAATDAVQRGYFLLLLFSLLYWIPIHATASKYSTSRFLMPLLPLLIVGAITSLAAGRFSGMERRADGSDGSRKAVGPTRSG